MTAREEFLAGLEAEYHDEDALRALAPTPAPWADQMLQQLIAELAEPITEADQRRFDLYGDLWP